MELLTKPGCMEIDTIGGNRLRNVEIFPTYAGMGLQPYLESRLENNVKGSKKGLHR